MPNEQTIYETFIDAGRGGKQPIKCVSTETHNKGTYENIYYFMGIPFYKTITDIDCCDDLIISKEILSEEILHTALHYLLINVNLYC